MLKQYSFKEDAKKNASGNVGNVRQYNWLLNHLADVVAAGIRTLVISQFLKVLKYFLQKCLQIHITNTLL